MESKPENLTTGSQGNEATAAPSLRLLIVDDDDFQIDADALDALCHYDWPGNVRELANVLERAQILAENNLITLDDLPENMQVMMPPPAQASSADPLNLAETERRTVWAALEQAKGNKVQAAKALGISRRSLYRLME